MNTQKTHLFLLVALISQGAYAKQYMFRDLFDQFEEEMLSSINTVSQVVPGFKTPTYDLQETNDAFIVSLAVPGLSKENIEIIVDEIPDSAMLTVRAVVKEESEEADEAKTYRKSAVYQQSFSQKIRLNNPVIVENVQADLKDGILTITLPKVAPTKKNSHTIKVK